MYRTRRSHLVRVVSLLVAAVLMIAVVRRLSQSRRPSTAGVATAHFKLALDDLTTRQDELCRELANTQVAARVSPFSGSWSAESTVV